MDIEQRDDWHLTELLGKNDGRSDPFAAAVRATRMPMVITDPNQIDNPIVFANEAFQKLSGYGREQIIGRNCRFLQGPNTDKNAVREIRRAVEAGNPIDIDILNYRRDGTPFWNALYLSPVRDDAGSIRFFFASQMDVTERIALTESIAHQKNTIEQEVRKRTEALEESDRAKTVLLHEVDHRVKNNLTMIGSLLRLQARSVTDAGTRSKLTAMLERVDALATVHRRLYEADTFTTFDVGGYAANLISDVIALTGRTDIAVETNCDKVLVLSSRASPLGLVINEIFTNVMKHAFPDDRTGIISVTARQAAGRGEVIIKDNGVGYDVGSVRTGLGSTLIQKLSAQAGATVTIRSGPSGSRFELAFPVEDET
ncbi:MAG: PAS domain-containing protein [Bradyrhizobiaceae bacterium]|nr:MAG: PAS domain-containing protein [Bradyrhizobiaceae bacterium]